MLIWKIFITLCGIETLWVSISGRERRERENACMCVREGASESDPIGNELRSLKTAICAYSRE